MRASGSQRAFFVPAGRAVVLALLLSLALGACAVRFVSDYDEVLDRSATETHAELTAFLDQLQDPSSPKRGYAASAETYATILGDLHAMRSRAQSNNADGGNAETVTQIETIEENVELLRDQHRKRPPSADAVRLTQQAIDLQFEALIRLELAKKRGMH